MYARFVYVTLMHAICYLVTPLIDHRHVDVIDEDGHFLPCWRAVSASHSFIYVTLHGALGIRRQREDHRHADYSQTSNSGA